MSGFCDDKSPVFRQSRQPQGCPNCWVVWLFLIAIVLGLVFVLNGDPPRASSAKNEQTNAAGCRPCGGARKRLPCKPHRPSSSFTSVTKTDGRADTAASKERGDDCCDSVRRPHICRPR